MKYLTFYVPGKPQGKARPRFANGHAYTTQKTRDYEESIKLAAISAILKRETVAGGWNTNERSYAVSIDAYFPIPKSFSTAKREAAERLELRPTVKPDADNIIKAVLDGLNGVAFEDDRLVSSCQCDKRYAIAGDEPGLYVIVGADDGADDWGRER